MIQKILKVFIAGLILASMTISCKHQQTIIKEEIVTRYIDSTIWHTDTTYFQVPVEVYADYISILDTLSLETNYAIAWSAVDTNNMLLVGEIRNKDIKIPIKYLWKERLIINDTTIYKEKEIPVEVEVVKTKIPTVFWITFFICIGLLVYVGIRLYLKFKP